MDAMGREQVASSLLRIAKGLLAASTEASLVRTLLEAAFKKGGIKVKYDDTMETGKYIDVEFLVPGVSPFQWEEVQDKAQSVLKRLKPNLIDMGLSGKIRVDVQGQRQLYMAVSVEK